MEIRDIMHDNYIRCSNNECELRLVCKRFRQYEIDKQKEKKNTFVAQFSNTLDSECGKYLNIKQ